MKKISLMVVCILFFTSLCFAGDYPVSQKTVDALHKLETEWRDMGANLSTMCGLSDKSSDVAELGKFNPWLLLIITQDIDALSAVNNMLFMTSIQGNHLSQKFSAEENQLMHSIDISALQSIRLYLVLSPAMSDAQAELIDKVIIPSLPAGDANLRNFALKMKGLTIKTSQRLTEVYNILTDLAKKEK